MLDEADEMLDMGFAEDIEAILDAVPTERQTVLFSATVPARINGLVKRYLTDPVKVAIARERSTESSTRGCARWPTSCRARTSRRRWAGCSTSNPPTATVVFCRTREEVDTLAETLMARGYRAEALHGGMTQDQRDRVMQRVRSGAAELLVATDVAARGLDIDSLTHVVNYDLPSAPDSYVHRIGRVGRAGRDGVAITLVEPRQHRLLKTIERAVRHAIPVETLPTVADLRARRLELTRAALHEALAGGDDNDQYRVVIDSLVDDYDLMEIALAAIKLAHESDQADEQDQDIPVVRPQQADDKRPRPAKERAPRSSGDTIRIFVGLGPPRRSGRRTSSARSPTRPACPDGRSGRSRSPPSSRSSRSRPRPRTR